MDPSIRSMFRGDMHEQGRKLMDVIGVAVSSMRRMDQIIPVIEEMGRKHAGYGVKDEHYATVGAALLWTLEAGLGSVFTDEVRDAWTAMYGSVASAMQRGAAN